MTEMTNHGDRGKQERIKGPFRKTAKPIAHRKVVNDCDIGDVVRFEGGREAIVSCWICSAPYGRYFDGDGVSGDLVMLPGDAAIVRIRGTR